MRKAMIRSMMIVTLLATLLIGGVQVMTRLLPAGEVMVLAMRNEGINRNDDLYLFDIQRAFTYRLTDDPELDTWPAVSPDDRQIVFQSLRSNLLGTYILDIWTGSLQQVTDLNPNISQPQWSPDGRALTYDIRGEIVIHDLAENSLRLLTNATNQRRWSPVWAQDGTSIVYLGYTDSGLLTYEVYRIDLEHETITQLTDNNLLEYGLAVSPDGQSVVYMTGEPPFANSRLYVLHLASGEIRHLHEAAPDSRFAAWSPDGDRIAFVSQWPGVPHAIEIIDARTGEIMQVIETPLPVMSPPQWIDLRH